MRVAWHLTATPNPPLTHGLAGVYTMTGSEEPPQSTIRARPGIGLARGAYLGAVTVAGSLVLCWSAVELVSRPPGALWLVLGALTVASASATVRLPGFPISFSLSDTFTIMAALLFGPEAGATLVALDGFVSSWRLRISTPTAGRVAFNVTSLALAMWLAARLFFAVIHRGPLAIEPPPMGGILGPLALFASAYFLLNTGLVAGAVTLGRQLSFYRVWREHFLPLWLTYFGGTSIAGLILLLMAAGLANRATLTLALPLVVVVFVAVLTSVERLRERSAQFARLRSYAAALRSTADAVLLTNVDRQITFMNAAAERLTGWTGAQAVGRQVQEVLRLEPSATGDEDHDRRDDAPDERSVREYKLVRQDGSTCPIEQTYAYIRDEGDDVEGVIRTFRDISQRKVVEAERQALLEGQQEARAAADAANRSKDEFLATLSHELRTPMTAILGWASLLKDGRMDDDRTQKALAALERSARAQATVMDDLLDISQIVRGTLRLAVRRTNLADVLSEATEILEPAITAKHIDLRLNVDPDVAAIDGDADRLRQVFWNLLSNAAKFTPEGGSIEVHAQRERSVVRVDVVDSGCGIDPAFLPFVFDRFRQENGSTKRVHRGLGLGLAIVREVVQLHGGTVEATSEGAGRGSRFVVRLPAGVRKRKSDVTFPPSAALKGEAGT
jgi:PAS domain S-box-containing protein